MNWKEYSYVDWHDKWNWISIALAIFLFWWGIKNIIAALSVSLIGVLL